MYDLSWFVEVMPIVINDPCGDHTHSTGLDELSNSMAIVAEDVHSVVESMFAVDPESPHNISYDDINPVVRTMSSAVAATVVLNSVSSDTLIGRCPTDDVGNSLSAKINGSRFYVTYVSTMELSSFGIRVLLNIYSVMYLLVVQCYVTKVARFFWAGAQITVSTRLRCLIMVF
jgi:hypothetical protein